MFRLRLEYSKFKIELKTKEKSCIFNKSGLFTCLWHVRVVGSPYFGCFASIARIHRSYSSSPPLFPQISQVAKVSNLMMCSKKEREWVCREKKWRERDREWECWVSDWERNGRTTLFMDLGLSLCLTRSSNYLRSLLLVSYLNWVFSCLF